MKSAEKVLALTLALSYTVYAVYWLIKGVTWFFESTFNGVPHLPPTGINPVSTISLFAADLMDYSAFIGLIIRAVGGFFAVYAALKLFRVKNSQYSAVKNKVVVLLVCEAVYFLSLVPSIAFLVWFSALSPLSNAFLSTQLAVQVIFIVPCLALLALKLQRNAGDGAVLGWTAVLALSYIFALWLSYQLKWLELFNGAQVGVSTVFGWLIENARLLSFLNTTIIFSVALLFAVLGIKYVVSKKTCIAVKMWSYSAFFVGLFFVFYVLYCSYLGAYWVIPFGEIWLIPLVFVGIYYLLQPVTTIRKGQNIC
jgi:hypothetical protein